MLFKQLQPKQKPLPFNQDSPKAYPSLPSQQKKHGYRYSDMAEMVVTSLIPYALFTI